ncbi:MAG: PQQ-binding-like beta-propeller repeat protein [Thermoguttaceae bacterium]|nr:PQQ-binding-like beta-propeller repeat protein [Thermoguttaceae bacterium]
MAHRSLAILLTAAVFAWLPPPGSPAGDQPQWGERFSRNMVSAETGLADRFDPSSGLNIQWSVPLGSQTYSTPVISGGKVLIGTNNNAPRDPRHQGDRGVMMCFDQADGRLVWQLVVPKLEGDIYLDWPRAGICSPATVEGDRVYTVTNRDEVVCLDLDGMADGNDGPFQEEGRHSAPGDQPAMEPGPLDADILWLLDLRSAAGVRPHDSAHSSILLDGDYLYANTSNGLTGRHDRVDKPEAPSLVAVEKASGRLVAVDGAGIGPRIFHSTWSSPALGVVAGRRLVFFCGGDGVVYAFDALDAEQAATASPDGLANKLNLVWRFDCDPTAPKENVHEYIRNRRESPSNIKSMPVFHEGRLYVTVGGDIWWGKRQAWLKCIDAGGEGDITATNLVWSYPLGPHCCSTPAISQGLVYVADCGGQVHCVDAATGKACWVHQADRDIWASTLVADGKVYIGTRRGDFWILAAGGEKRVIGSVRLDGPVHGTATAAGGVLYVASMERLYAIGR